MRSTGSQAKIKADMPFWGKEKGIVVWGFKGKEDNSQKVEKSQCLVNKYLSHHADKTLRHREDFDFHILPSSPQPTTPNSYSL